LRENNSSQTKVPTRRKSVLPDISKIGGARKGLLPAFLEPSLASLCDTPPTGPKWVHEIKYDGYRMQARIAGQDIRLLTRKKLDWTKRFRSIAVALEELRIASALLDGEIVVEDANGISSFNDLQSDLKAGRQDRFRYHVFDMLYCDAFDLTQATLIDRKALLQGLLKSLPAASPIRFSEHLEEDGRTMFEHARKLGLEGIVSKRKDLPYRPGRGEHWLKSKCVQRQEFVILGYVRSAAVSGSVGAVLLGYQNKGKLIYAGRVGTGWSAEQARSLRADILRRLPPPNRLSAKHYRQEPTKAFGGLSLGSCARSNTVAGLTTACFVRPHSRGSGRTSLRRKSFSRRGRSHAGHVEKRVTSYRHRRNRATS
jgi:bifunctional non-homologous end joining protein LigD